MTVAKLLTKPLLTKVGDLIDKRIEVEKDLEEIRLLVRSTDFDHMPDILRSSIIGQLRAMEDYSWYLLKRVQQSSITK